MPSRPVGNTLDSTLFLVCPTDSMEQLVHSSFEGEAFFHTALGVYFEFGFNIQSTLCELICENSITQIVFASAINNVFYRHALEKNAKHNYPVDRALAKAKVSVLKHLVQAEVFPSNFHLLAARHLTNQKERLLSTHILGNHLKRENIVVKAYVYQPENNIFYDLNKIEQRGYLLDCISYN